MLIALGLGYVCHAIGWHRCSRRRFRRHRHDSRYRLYAVATTILRHNLLSHGEAYRLWPVGCGLAVSAHIVDMQHGVDVASIDVDMRMSHDRLPSAIAVSVATAIDVDIASAIAIAVATTIATAICCHSSLGSSQLW